MEIIDTGLTDTQMNTMESQITVAEVPIENFCPAAKSLIKTATSIDKISLEGPQAGSESETKTAEVEPTKRNAYIEYCQGYVACAKESIRFLTEVEGLPVEHPLVVSIQEELNKRIQMVGFHMMIQELFESQQENCDDSTEGSTENEEPGSIPPEGESSCTAHVQDISDGTNPDSESDVDLARYIAEQIYDMLNGDNMEDSGLEEVDDSDRDTSNDEGFHSDLEQS